MEYSLDDLNREKEYAEWDKEYTEWDYIKFCLWSRDMKIEDLKDIFGVTSTAIAKWKNGEPISREKKVYLAKLFGVTLDQFYMRENSDGYMSRLCYDLQYIVDPENYKKLTDNDLRILFESEAKYGWFIEQVLEDNEIDGTVTPDEFDYFCQHLQVNYTYELNAQNEDDEALAIAMQYLNYEKLLAIKKELKASWGNEEILNKLHYNSIDLIDIMLRSENIKYISKFVFNDVCNTLHNETPVYLDPKKYMDKYVKLKEANKDFDINGEVLKTLIADDIVFWNEDKPDYEKTFKYLHKFIRHEIYNKYIEEEE